MNLKLTSAALLGGFALAACANSPPAPAVSNSPQGAPSGISGSNGGGQRQLGDIPNIGTDQGAPTTGNVPSSAGAAY